MNKIVGSFALCLLSLSISVKLLADTRPDAHAPISVMGDHKHEKGEFMFSYRFMHMNMGENMDGNDEVSVSDILATDGDNYLVSPVDMEMDMHMFGLMYAPTDRLTLMAMINMVDVTMDHQLRDMIVMMNPAIDSNLFTTEADGFGDTQLGGIYELSNQDGASWLLNMGLSVPTGSFDEKDIIPTVSTTEDSQLPFPMQIGSGTFDFIPGVTYSKINEDTSWGAQVKATIRLDENDNGYTKGNRFEAQAWHAWLLNHHVSLSTRLSVADWGDYDGLDADQALPLFNTLMGANTVPTVNPDLRGGSQADFAVGINTSWGESGHRVAAELAYPVWHDLDGPQLATDLSFTLGYQIAF